mgnify:CR=1 FL=1
MSSLKSKTGEQIRLTSFKARAEVTGMGFSCLLSQSFENLSDNTVECRYEINLAQTSSTAATVNGLTARVSDGRTIIAEVQEKRSAERRYDDAVASGHGAFLLEKTEDNTFGISIGSLPPRGSVTLKVFFVGDVDLESTADGLSCSI